MEQVFDMVVSPVLMGTCGGHGLLSGSIFPDAGAAEGGIATLTGAGEGLPAGDGWLTFPDIVCEEDDDDDYDDDENVFDEEDDAEEDEEFEDDEFLDDEEDVDDEEGGGEEELEDEEL